MRKRSERGAALVEAAVTIPILLLIAVGIFEFGRAYQTWQVLTNAAREGARMSVTPNTTAADVQALVQTYMQNGGLPNHATANVQVARNVALPSGGTASTITIGYPFSFMVLQPVIQLIHAGSATGEDITMSATATMRNEAGASP